MNKKGFTTIEVIVCFALIAAILASMTSVIVNYRDRVINAQAETRILDFKNTFTKLIYDDIITENITSMSECVGNYQCVNLIGSDSTVYPLTATTYESATGNYKKGIYFSYKSNYYFLPESELNSYDVTGNNDHYMINVDSFRVTIDDTNHLYKVIIPIQHYGINKSADITLVIS